MGFGIICSLCGRRERNVRRTPEPSGPRRLHELLCCLRATLILNRPAHIDSGLMIGPEFGRGLASVCEWGVMSATMMALMGRPSQVESGQWGFATVRSHRGRPGRIHMLSA